MGAERGIVPRQIMQRGVSFDRVALNEGVAVDDMIELSYALRAFDPHELPELCKTREELRIISLCTRLMNKRLRSLGFPGARYPHDRIHLVDARIMQDFDPKLAGFLKNGHIYTIRRADDELHMLMHNLTHELAHYISHSRAEATLTRATRHSEFEVSFLTSRIGFGIASPRGLRFSGLNEACTELFANELRRRILASPWCQKRWNLDAQRGAFSYYAQVRVVSALQFLLKTRDRDTKMLYRDYINGSFDFVRAVNELIPGAGRILGAMGLETRDAIVAAEALGFPELAAELTEKMKPPEPASTSTT